MSVAWEATLASVESSSSYLSRRLQATRPVRSPVSGGRGPEFQGLGRPPKKPSVFSSRDVPK
ncbi:MAG: hypothetical protein MZU79_08975 [Anaerotruncus sp.]|nr:hypothetical protein [Anaerotruncus sp.]